MKMLSVIALVLIVLPSLASSFPQNYPTWRDELGVLEEQPYPLLSAYLRKGYVCCNQPPTPPVPRYKGKGLGSLAMALAKREAAEQRFPIPQMKALKKQTGRRDEESRQNQYDWPALDTGKDFGDDSNLSNIYNYNDVLLSFIRQLYNSNLLDKRAFVAAAESRVTESLPSF